MPQVLQAQAQQEPLAQVVYQEPQDPRADPQVPQVRQVHKEPQVWEQLAQQAQELLEPQVHRAQLDQPDRREPLASPELPAQERREPLAYKGFKEFQVPQEPRARPDQVAFPGAFQHQDQQIMCFQDRA